MRKKSILLLLLSSLVLSVAGHLFFLQEWPKGQFMVGPNDGLSQIIPFKKFLYDHYKEGNFFYSWGFGLGGGFYSQLAYYFSTSVFFLATFALVFFMESIQVIRPPDLFFWMNAAIVISMIRLSLILFFTTLVYRYMNICTKAAFSGAAVYGLSIMYFRHAVFWEFFADAMLWIPFLVFSVEKIIRDKKPGFFIVTLSLMLINNFYFAYINLIFTAVYTGFRWIIPLTKNEGQKRQQLILMIKSSIISFFISAVSFVPAVYGFLNNERPPYEQDIPIIDFSDNLFFSSRFIILPAVFFVFLLMFSFYKNRVFALYAGLSLFFILLHSSPLAASAFNGFSAPQYRWEYLLSFTAGGVTAAGLTLLQKVRPRESAISVGAAIMLYGAVGYVEQNVPTIGEKWASLLAFIASLLLAAAFFIMLFSFTQKRWALTGLQGIILLSSVLVVNVYQKYAVFDYSVYQVSTEFLNSEAYSSKEQKRLLEKIKKEEEGRLFRIDWMTEKRNNTPIVQDFNGTSLYSSIFNENLLSFYWHDLKIDMGRESVSRYASLGNRANLHSLVQADYWIRKKSKSGQAPYGFVLFAESENYAVYKNTMPLPFIRTAKKVFSEQELRSASPLDREHAMLEGIVLNRQSNEQIVKEKNHMDSTAIQAVHAAYSENRLTVTGKTGGIDLIPEGPHLQTGDFYVHFSIENLEGKGFPLKVNEYRTTRKPASSIYKTSINDLVIRVPKKEKISIRVPKGTYELKELELYEENYSELKAVSAKAEESPAFEWNRNKISLDFNNQSGAKYMMFPIPYEKGWELNINGKSQPVEKANYAWTGFALKEGMNQIRFVYYPPYFRFSLLLTCIGLFVAVRLAGKRKKRQKTE